MKRSRCPLIFVLILIIALSMLSCSSDRSVPNRSDSTGPRVVATVPAAGATQVPTNTPVIVTFSEPIDPRSVLVLVNGFTRGPITIEDSVVTMTLDQRLFQNVEYFADIPPGVEDLAGNSMDSAYSWAFTTGFSPLGETWTEQTSPTTAQLNRVVRGSQYFLAVGSAGTILTSPDGLNWTSSTFDPAADQLWSAFPVGERFIVCGSPGTILASSEMDLWTQDTLADSITNLFDIWIALDGIYMVGTGGASGTDGILVKYSSPANWTSVNLGPHLTPRSITQFGNDLIIVGDSGLVMTSSDGTVWTDHSFDKFWGDLTKVKWAGQYGKLIAVGSAIVSSTDGITWSQHTATSSQLFRDVSWTHISVEGTTYKLACAVGDSGKVFISNDAINWTPQTTGITSDLMSIAQGLVPARFVAVGEGGVIYTSD